MNNPTLWQCPNCGEQHREEFHICWKCGSNPAGDRDPEFLITEPVREQDQTPDSPTDETELPVLQLPSITYISIPTYICFELLTLLTSLEHLSVNRITEFRLSPIKLVGYCIATILIGIPVFFTTFRAMHFSFSRRLKPPKPLGEMLWMLSMFRLPESIQRSYRWFVPLYYGSIAALLIVPVGLVAWQFLRLT